MITVVLPNGQQVDVDAPDNQTAAASARLYFQREFPQEFEAWSRTLPAGGFGARISRGIDEAQGRLYSAVENVGALLGSETIQQFGREGELRNRLEAERSMPAAQMRDFAGAEGVGGVLSAAQQAVAGSLPELPGPLAGGFAGFRVAGVPGAVVGAALGSLPSFVGGNVQRRREVAAQETGQEPERIPSPGTALAAGAAQAAVSGALDVLTLRLARVLGVPAAEVGANLLPRIARGVGAGAVTEMPSEVIETAIERAQAGLPVLDEAALREYQEAAIGGAVAGGAFGGAAAGAFGPRPSRPLTDEQVRAAVEGEQPPAPEQAAPTGPEPLVGERPQPFAAPDQAAEYLTQNPAPAGLRTPEAATAWANARRQAEWESQVEAARPTALTEFTSPPAAPEATPLADQNFFSNLADAAVTDQIRLTGFKPVDVARYAFESRGLQNIKPSTAEINAVTQRLDSLVSTGFLEKTEAGNYRVSTRPPGQAAPAAPAAEVQPPVAEPPPSADEVTETPASQQAAQNLSAIAQTGNPAPPSPPVVQANANLWRAYTMDVGPERLNPIVVAAKEVARARRRPFTLNQFQTFANAWAALPTDADRALFAQQVIQNPLILGGRRAPTFQAPNQPIPPTVAPQPTLPQPTQPSQPEAPPAAPEVVPPAQPVAVAPKPAQPAAPEPAAPREEVQAPAAPPEAEAIPSEAVAEDLSPAADTDIRETDNKIYSILAGILPDNPTQGRQMIARATRDTLFNKFTRGFFSPILTMPKWRPEMAAAGRVARFFLRRTNQYNVEIQNLLARQMAGFTPEQQSVMGRRLEQSSKEEKPFNRDGLTPEMIAKMEDIQRAGQRSFDYFIEANIIKFYDPAEAKTPASRAAIEQMWRRNPGRSLIQISDADLRAASPDGFEVKQDLERLRNKYYLPMTSDGKTHFIAAYPKGPDGKRKVGTKPVAVVPLNPLAPKRRKPGVPDPEVLARQELTDRGITAARYYITPAPVEFTRDAEIASIRDNADFIASFVEKLRKSVGNNAEAQALLRDMQTSLDKARMQGILKPNQGILIPITRLNESTYLTKTVPQYYAGLGKLQSRRYTEHSFQRAIKDLNPKDQAYWREHRDYMSAPAEAAWISNIRSFNFHWFMGAALDTAILNATQVYSSTMPLLVRDGGVQGATITQRTINEFFSSLETGKAAAGRDIETYIKSLARSVAKTPEEAQALARAARLEIFTPIFTTESGGVSDVNIKEALIARGYKNPDRIQKGVDTLMNLSGLPQRTAETLNRSITFLAAYRLAKQNPEVIERANRLDGYNFTGPNAAFEYAVSRVDDSQLITTAEDRAYFMRAIPGAELITQFMSYPAKMAEIWFTQWRNGIVGLARQEPELARAGAIGLMLYSAPMIAFAGIWGLPFGEQLREGIEALIKLIWKDVENFDDDLRYALGDGFWAKFVTRGLPHASGLANTSQRMAIDPIPFQEISEWTPLQLAGPIGGSLIDTITSIYGYASRGDYFNALAAAMPRVIGNALKGANLEFGTGEYRTPQGNVIISESQIDELDRNSLIPISVRQALGLQSPAVADLRTAYQVARETQTQNRSYAESLNNRLTRTEADRVRALRDNNPDAAAAAIAEQRRIIEEHGRRNEAYEQAGERDKMYNPNMATIRRQALEMVYGRTSPEMMARMGGPSTRGEIQELSRRYGPQ